MSDSHTQKRPRFELRQVLTDGTEKAEVCTLAGLAGRAQAVHLDRRSLIGLSAITAGAALLASCCGGKRSATPTPKATAAPTSTVVPLEARLCGALQAHPGDVAALAFSPDGALLASAGDEVRDDTPNWVKVWRTADGSLVRRLDASVDEMKAVAFSPDGAFLAAGGKDGVIRLWRTSDWALVHELRKQNHIEHLAFSPDGTLLASAGWNPGVCLWRVGDGSPAAAVKDRKGADLQSGGGISRAIAFSPDGSLVAAPLGDPAVAMVWRVADGSLVRELKGADRCMWSTAFSPDGALLVAGGCDGTLRIWQTSDWKVRRDVLQRAKEPFWSIAFNADGSLLATGNGYWLSGTGDMVGPVQLWQTSDWSVVRELQGHYLGVYAVAFGPNGALLASGGNSPSILLWDTANGSMSPVKLCFFDPTATRAGDAMAGRTYEATDAQGVKRTYTVPCRGSTLPTGAVCTCDCIPGTWYPPSNDCSCNQICTCIPVRG